MAEWSGGSTQIDPNQERRELYARIAQLEKQLEIEKEHGKHIRAEVVEAKKAEKKKRIAAEAELEKLSTVIDRIKQVWRSDGCSSNNCVMEKPKGVGTNGGCRCYENRSLMMRVTQRVNAVLLSVE